MIVRLVGAFLAMTMLVGSIRVEGEPSPAALPDRIDLPEDAGSALLWPGGSQAVLLAHGAIYDAASWEDQAVVMHDAGYTVLSLENISAEAIRTGISWLLEDRDAIGVVIIGASAGGSGALRALAERPKGVVGLVLLGATGDVASLGDYPKLFTASEGEGMVDRLEQMASDGAGERNRVEVIAGDAHAQATFNNPEGEQLLNAIMTFLEEEAIWSDVTATPMGHKRPWPTAHFYRSRKARASVK